MGPVPAVVIWALCGIGFVAVVAWEVHCMRRDVEHARQCFAEMRAFARDGAAAISEDYETVTVTLTWPMEAADYEDQRANARFN